MYLYMILIVSWICMHQTSSNVLHPSNYNEVGVTENELKERLLSLYDPIDVLYEFPPFAEGLELVLDLSERDAVSSRRENVQMPPSRYGNTCPGYFVNNTNTNRVPSVIAEWRCSCQRCQLPRGSMPSLARNRYRCKPIYQLYPTLHTTERTSPTAEWAYRLEPISVGCKCEDYRPMSALVIG